ncbi:exported protein [Mycobacteroides abscessus subsp. bolletii]|uniref:NlpC/P60 family protein n=1 Tax=Mycobacteroides abscessus TaxID=36809 RepID=UPI0009C776C7|nr:NlpC/P60 family protein [Mycobacteroides abscessus]SKG75786.1 exported protein [Mycobacteroides abscessus subsp. bolletii]SKH09270.1 exported protein [Mycobacteroides abscessus subsp. bolletii]
MAAEFVAAQASVHIVPSLKDFRSRLRAQLATVEQSVSVEVKAQTAKALAEIKAAKELAERDPIDLQVKLRFDAKKPLTEIRHIYQDLKADMLKGLKLNIMVAGATQLSQLGVALAALNTSVVELGQSALLLPGIFSGVASSVGALAVGTRGVTDAFKAYSNAQKDSADAARQQVQANRNVADATLQLDRAVKDAKRNLEDLNSQLRDAPLDEAEAVLNVQEARQEAAKTFGKSALQMQRDNLNVQKSEARLAETRRRNARLIDDVAEANAKGVRNSDNVVAALNRLSTASEEAGESSGALKEWQDAMGRLSPEARNFVTQLTAMSGQWDTLRQSVQDGLFAGLGEDVRQLGEVGLPVLNRGLTSIASGINSNLKTAIASLRQGSNLSMIESIFGSTADAQRRLDGAINPMVDAFLRLSTVGASHLPRLATAFDDVMRRFDTFIKRASADGSLDRWISRGEKSLKDLGNSLINIGSIMNTISDIFVGSNGKGLLASLESGTKRLSDYLKTVEGHNKVRQFFLDARAEFERWKPVLSDVWAIIRNVKDGVMAWGGTVLPVLRTVSQLLAGVPGLAAAITYAILGWRTLSPVFQGVNKALGLIDMDFRNVVKSVGEGKGFTGKLRVLANVLGTGGALAVASVAAGGILYTLADKQDMAATKASRHADEIRRLRSELNNLTGELTNQGLIDKLNALGEYKPESGWRGESIDIPKQAEKVGIDRNKLGQILTPRQEAARNAELGRLDKITEGALTGTDYWKKNHEAFEKVGISSDVLARALGGDQQAIDKFNAAFAAGQIPGGGPASLHPDSYTLADIQQGANRMGKRVLPGLGDQAQSASQVAGAVRSNVAGSNEVSNDIRKNNAAAGGGEVTLKPDNPFRGLNVDKAYRDPVRGGGAVVLNTPFAQLPEQLVKDVEANSGTVEPLDGGLRSQVTMNRDRFELYAGGKPFGPYVGAHKAGGFLSGPGTGTSDSMLARVSNGEYIVKASSVSKYGLGLLHSINDGELPRFDEGGPVMVGPKQPYQPVDRTVVPNPGPAAGNYAKDWYGTKPAPGVAATPAPTPMPDMSNPGLYNPATGSYTALPDGLGDRGVGTGANVPQVPTAVETRHGLGIAVPGGSQYSALPGPDMGAQVPQDTLVPQQQLGLASLPENLQPVNILSQLGEILLQFVAGFFGIDLSYFNAFKSGLSGVTHRIAPGQAANPEAQALQNLAPNPLAGSTSALLEGSTAQAMSAQPAAARAAAMAESMAGKPYTWGGSTLDGTDCSGLVMYVADAYTGKQFSGRSGGTGTEGDTLRAKGAVIISDPSQAPAGTLRIGWNGSHTAGTLPDGRNFEASTFGKPIAVGSGAQGYNASAFTNWAYFPAGYAAGGLLSGPGTGTSDSMLARVSNGEFIVKASSVSKYGAGMLHALNEGKLPRFDEGGPVLIPGMVAPAPQAAPQPIPDPQGPQAQQAQQSAQAQAQSQQGAQAATQSQVPQTDTAVQTVGDAMSGIGNALSGVGGGGSSPGAEAPEGATAEQDPRSILGAAPTNQDHNAPWLTKGIQGAASTIGSALSTAISAAGSAAGAGAPGAGAGASAAGSMAAAGAQIAGQVASGAVNILSSLMVGTLTGGTTQGAYGAPVLPGPPQSSGGPGGPGIVNNYGDIHTANYDEFYKGQQRREAQQQAPLLPMR